MRIILCACNMTDIPISQELISALQQIAEPKITDWVMMAVVILNLFLAAIIIFQYSLSKKVFEQDHEKSRKEKAIELLMFWDQTLARSSTLARKLVENFNFEQSKQLLNQEAITNLDIKYKNSFLTIFPDLEKQGQEGIDETVDGNFFTLKKEYFGLLRWEIISYLNNLETVLSSWAHNVCDKKMIAEQFEYLVSTQNNHFLLEYFRQACGPSSYPCISKFITELKEQAVKPNPSKKKLGK